MKSVNLYYKRIIASNMYKKLEVIIWMVLLVASISVMFCLVYKQAVYPLQYNSDLEFYIDMVDNIDDATIAYPVMFYLAYALKCLLGNTQIAMAIAVTFFNFMALIITKSVLNKQSGEGILSSIGTVLLFFSSMIFNHRFIPFGIPHYYVGVGTPNPWHNATYVAARPFVILSFLLGAYTLDHYENDFTKGNKFTWSIHKYYIGFAITMLLCTLTKPAYNLPHMGVVFLVAVYRCLKNRFKTFRQSLWLAITYIPTIIVLLWQYLLTFTNNIFSNYEQGIAFKLGGAWTMYSDNIPLAIILATLFPFIILIIHRKQLIDSEQFRFAWQIFIVGLLINLCLIEIGPRAKDGNFGWGHLYGLFLVFFVSILEWMKDIRILLIDKCLKKHIIITVVETIFMSLHFVFGIHYLQLLFMGYDYKLPWY